MDLRIFFHICLTYLSKRLSFGDAKMDFSICFQLRSHTASASVATAA